LGDSLPKKMQKTPKKAPIGAREPRLDAIPPVFLHEAYERENFCKKILHKSRFYDLLHMGYVWRNSRGLMSLTGIMISADAGTERRFDDFTFDSNAKSAVRQRRKATGLEQKRTNKIRLG
jgi:hypothetical protein